MQEETLFTHSNSINIPHFSSSTLNSFIENRYGFYQSKVMGKPFQGSIYTARGTAVEFGVNTWIENESHGNLLEVSLLKFDEEIKRAGVSRIAAEDTRDTIKGLLETALAFYKIEFDKNKAVTQRKIESTLVGVTRPIIGYLDYFQMGVAVRDSKVVSRTPSALKQAYVLQGALYKQATGLDVYFDFFVDNKKPVHKPIKLTDDEFIFGISYLTRAAQVLEELEECDNPKRIIELMSFPNLDAFYSYPEKAEAAKTWGIALP